FGIKTDYELQFYSIAESISYGGTEYKNVASLYDSSLISYIKDRLKEATFNYGEYKNLIREIEIFNQLKNYVTDLKSVYKPRNASPVWESKSYDNIPLALPVFEGEGHVFRSKELLIDSENKEISDLKYYVQYIRKNDEIFVKIILLNKGS